ncbi:MAG: RluA family pseudouridine synthase [Gammaproteobacteria bacterium]|nr:RluA family pseudouridine synthase [Gammaproteobacteria bacterium]
MTPRTTIVAITVEDEGRRVDNFLFNIMKGIPKSRIYRAIRKGEVRVNKKRVDADTKLMLDDQVRIPPIMGGQDESVVAETPSAHLVELLKQRILYEDDTLIVLNKPSGLAVHGGSGVSLGVVEALRTLYPKLELGLVHRLDRDTSGCLMIAKKRSTLRALHEQMREGTVKKIYACLLQGRLAREKITVDKALRKYELSSGERMVTVDDGEGKASKTIFYRVQQYPDACLVKAELKTGRTHQIRVHSASIGHPVAGDDKYGNKEFNKAMRQKGLKRLFLHAAELTFTLPKTQEIMTIEAKLDTDLQDFINHLGG